MAIDDASYRGVKSCLVLASATHDVSFAVSSHAFYGSIEDGAIVAVGVAVWDAFDFRFLLQQHLVSDESLVRWMMMVKRRHRVYPLQGKTFLAMLMRVCVVHLLKLKIQTSSLG